MRTPNLPQDEPGQDDEWFGTSILMHAVEERASDGFPKNTPENLPLIFAGVFETHFLTCGVGAIPSTWSN